MELSIIVVNWNTKGLVVQCLEALLHSVKKAETEILVVDNGSVDGSAALIKERYPDVTLIENPINVGFARANNQALKRSEGKYLFLINPDTRVKEETTEALLSFMEGHPEAGLLGAQLLNADGSKQNSVANFPSLATELLNKSLLRRLFPASFPGKERSDLEPIAVDSVIGACMMLRREVVEQVGLFDEDYFLFFEETDWCYRIRRAGWKIYHVPQSKIYHFQGKSAEKDRKRAKVEYYRSRYLFFKKNKGKAQLFLVRIGLVIKLGMEIVGTIIGCLFTFFTMKHLRRRLSILGYLMWWHLRLCPNGMGLKPDGKDAKR